MCDSGDTIADFVVFGDFRSEGNDGPGEIASYRDSGCGESGDVNVLPVIVGQLEGWGSMVVLGLAPVCL
jgi:hypothetical protein